MATERVDFTVKKEVGLHDTTLLERALDSLPGVSSVGVNRQSDRIAVGFDGTQVTREEIRAKIEILGYPVQDTHERPS